MTLKPKFTHEQPVIIHKRGFYNEDCSPARGIVTGHNPADNTYRVIANVFIMTRYELQPETFREDELEAVTVE